MGLNYNNQEGNFDKINIKNRQYYKINPNFNQNVEDFQIQLRKNYASNQTNQRHLNIFINSDDSNNNNNNNNNYSIIQNNNISDMKPAGISQPLPLHKVNNYKFPSSSIIPPKKKK
jgi:hypothetical protein